MRNLNDYCYYCKKETKQQATVESWLDVSGFVIFINYWTRCLECGKNILNYNKEIEREQL